MTKLLILVGVLSGLFAWSVGIGVASFCFAEEKYFDFVSKSGVIGLDGSYEAELLFDVEEEYQENLLVRPRIDKGKGVVNIYNSETRVWTAGNGDWSKMPEISREVRLRIFGIEDETTEIYFEILDKKTAKLHLTPSKTIYGRRVHEQYIEKLNGNILGWDAGLQSGSEEVITAPGEEAAAVTEAVETSNTQKTSFAVPTKYRWIFLGAFGCAVLAGTIHGLVQRNARGNLKVSRKKMLK